MSQESDQLPKEGQELQQENPSSTTNEGENVDGVGLQESTNSGMNTEKMLEMFTNAIASENDRQSHNMLEMFTNAIASENDRQSHNMTTLLATALKNLAITIQNSKVSKMVTPEPDELNQNYSKNWLNRISAKEAGKAYYDTRGRRGLLCILLLEKDWVKANKNDEEVLRELFGKTLGFDVETFTSYDDLENKMDDLTEDTYYCLLICISGHGFEDAVITKSETSKTKKRKILELKTTDSIKDSFSNASITALSGVPKIIILDTCRGSKEDISVAIRSPDTKRKTVPDYLPTTHSDCIIIHAATLGNVAFVPDDGSVGIQGVVKALNANWKTDHLEEILVDARREVAMFNVKGIQKEIRQTLETQSTLTKRLMFVEVKDK